MNDPNIYLRRFSDWLSTSPQTTQWSKQRALGSLLLAMLRALADLRGALEYKWAFDHPPQQLPADVVVEVATHARHAAWMLGITRCCASIFALGKTEAQTSISRQLSRSLSGRLKDHRQFHQAHLRAVSGARVDLFVSDQSDLLQLRAEGTVAQIRALRLEVQRYIDAACMVGMPAARASRYFMEGSTLLLFEGGTSLRAQVRFRPSEGGWSVPFHALKKRMTPQLNTPSHGDAWRAEARVRFLDLWSIQLSKMLGSNILAQKSRLEARVRFGTFYFTDVRNKLPKTCLTMSVAELQEALAKHGRHRKLCRPEPPKALLPKSTHQEPFPMTEIKPSKGRVSGKTKTKEKGL